MMDCWQDFKKSLPWWALVAAILLIFRFISGAGANDAVTRYLVYPASFTTTQRDALISYGFKDHPQPILNTNYSLADSKMGYSYFILTVSTTLPIQNTALLDLETLGKIKKLDTFHIITEPDGRLGGVVTTVTPLTVFSKEPEPFVVEKTTP